MEEQSRAAIIQARVACALIEMESMRAANRECFRVNEPADYGETAFLNLIDRHGIGHNAVLTALREGT